MSIFNACNTMGNIAPINDATAILAPIVNPTTPAKTALPVVMPTYAVIKTAKVTPIIKPILVSL